MFLQYADDASQAATFQIVIDRVKTRGPKQLKVKNILVNDDTTEDYPSPRKDKDKWQEYKILGS